MNELTVRELFEQIQRNNDRLTAIADAMEREQRERTEAEAREVEKITRENQILTMRMQSLNMPSVRAEANRNQLLRDCMTNNVMARFVLTREMMTTEGLADTGLIPVNEQDMLKPLREELIWNKLGINIQSGCVGELRWPKHTKAVAQVADEAEELVSTKIDFSALKTSGQRIGIAIDVTREDIYNSQGRVESVINEEMPTAVSELINHHMFSLTSKSKIAGPFANAKVQERAITFAGSVPTRGELLKLKAQVLSSGIKVSAPCFVMTEAMKAELENVPVDKGSGRFLCEGDKVLGYPVFCTHEIGEGNVGFGDWSYQAAAFFGQTDVVVDPYTLAKKHATAFVLNMSFGTVTLYDEAFSLGQTAEAKAALSAE